MEALEELANPAREQESPRPSAEPVPADRSSDPWGDHSAPDPHAPTGSSGADADAASRAAPDDGGVRRAAESNQPIEPGSPSSGLLGRFRTYVGLSLLLLFGVGFYHQLKPMPEGTRLEGAVHSVDASGIEFLYDLTYRDRDDRRVVEQRIFDRLFQLIENADAFLIVDMFLFNQFAGDPENAYRPLTRELTERLLERRLESPDLPILLITDEINTVYGSEQAPHLERLRQADIDVVLTDLRPLRDSNPVYSSLWRVFFQWFGNEQGGGDLVNPFDPEDQTTLRSYLRVANFKANHRKVAIAGHDSKPAVALVTSANPHDGSSAHSNVAVVVEGQPALDLARSELAIARFSGWDGGNGFDSLVEASAQLSSTPGSSLGRAEDTHQVEVLSEGGVRDRLIDDIAATSQGDAVHLAMFYFSHRGVIDALVAAADRGVRVRLILDANRDAFGRQKNGVPNRPVANELLNRSENRIAIRWYETHGEQFHSKMTAIRQGNETIVVLGSTNLTRRNLDDYNLEATVRVVASAKSNLALQVEDYFERIWNNRGGALYTIDYDRYADPSESRYWAYRVMEATGMSSF